MNAVLRVDSIGKSFGHWTVLRAASMDAPAGTVTALLGRNGAGKSTLLKIAAGWLSPDPGFVEVGGQRYLRPRLGTLTRAGVFYLSVDRSILSPAFTLDQHLDALEKRVIGDPHAAEPLLVGRAPNKSYRNHSRVSSQGGILLCGWLRVSVGSFMGATFRERRCRGRWREPVAFLLFRPLPCSRGRKSVSLAA